MYKSQNSSLAPTPEVAGQTWRQAFPHFAEVYDSEDKFGLTELANALSTDMQRNYKVDSRPAAAEAFLEAVKTEHDFEYFRELVRNDVETDGQSNFVTYNLRAGNKKHITYADLKVICTPQKEVAATASETKKAANTNWFFGSSSSSTSAQNSSNSSATAAASVEIPEPVRAPRGPEPAKARIEQVMLYGMPVYAVVAGVNGDENQYVFNHKGVCLGRYKPVTMPGYSATVENIANEQKVEIENTRAGADYFTKDDKKNLKDLHAKNLGLLKVGVFSNQTPEGKHSVSAISYNGKWYDIGGKPYNTTSKLPAVVQAALESQKDSFTAQMKAANLKLLSVTTVSYKQGDVEVTVPAIKYNGAFYDERGNRISGKGIPNLPPDVQTVAETNEGIQAKLSKEYRKLISQHIEKADMTDDQRVEIERAINTGKEPIEVIEQVQAALKETRNTSFSGQDLADREGYENIITKPIDDLMLKSPENTARELLVSKIKEYIESSNQEPVEKANIVFDSARFFQDAQTLYEGQHKNNKQAHVRFAAALKSAFNEAVQKGAIITRGRVNTHYEINMTSRIALENCSFYKLVQGAEFTDKELQIQLRELDAKIAGVFRAYAEAIDNAYGFKTNTDSEFHDDLHTAMLDDLNQLISHRNAIAQSDLRSNKKDFYKFNNPWMLKGLSYDSFALGGRLTLPAVGKDGKMETLTKENSLKKFETDMTWNNPKTWPHVMNIVYKMILSALRVRYFKENSLLKTHQKHLKAQSSVVLMSGRFAGIKDRQASPEVPVDGDNPGKPAQTVGSLMKEGWKKEHGKKP